VRVDELRILGVLSRFEGAVVSIVEGAIVNRVESAIASIVEGAVSRVEGAGHCSRRRREEHIRIAPRCFPLVLGRLMRHILMTIGDDCVVCMGG